jgi:hypothetical protein
MFWDSLTAAGLCLSVLTTTGAFYLVLRDRPRLPGSDTGR